MENPHKPDAPSEPDPFATPHLFRHHYDIDTVIAALCTGNPSQIETGAATFPIQPLPASFLPEALTHRSFAYLEPTTQATVQQLASQPLAQLPQHFHTPAGDWLRARIKDAALEWLDSHNLIPPSMRHVPRQSRALQSKPAKVVLS